MNKIIIIGALGSDPVSRVVGDGIQVCSFSVAVNPKKKDDPTLWVRVTAWRQLANLCQEYLAKGRKVAVVGSVGLNTYTDKEGQQKSSLEVTADEVEFLSPRDDSRPADNSVPDAPRKSQAERDAEAGYIRTDDEESLPF